LLYRLCYRIHLFGALDLHNGLEHTNTGSGDIPKVEPPKFDNSLPQLEHLGLKKLSITFKKFNNVFILFLFLIMG
jgi:hypothetical protein